MILGRWRSSLRARLAAAAGVGALLLVLAGGCGSESAPQKPPDQKPPAKAPDQKPPAKTPSQDSQQPGGT